MSSQQEQEKEREREGGERESRVRKVGEARTRGGGEGCGLFVGLERGSETLIIH